MPRGLLQRITRELGGEAVLERLMRLAPSDLQSLLLELFAQMAGHLSPPQLLAQYEQNRFVAPSAGDPRVFVEIDRLAWSVLPEGYAPLELSPVAPLGTSSVVATVHQHKVLSALRGTEVLGDSTNLLALECAARRRSAREGRRAPVRLAASHRLVRAQTFKGPRTWPHFRVIALCAAGRDEGTLRFECRELLEQLAFYLRLVDGLAALGRPFTAPRLAVTDLTGGALEPLVRSRVFEPLAQRFPALRCAMDPTRSSGRGYYRQLCFKLYATHAAGHELELADGGDVGWTGALLSDAKERLVISGIGIERMAVV